MTRYPGSCPSCASPAYVGLSSIKCTGNGCANRDPDYDPTLRIFRSSEPLPLDTLDCTCGSVKCGLCTPVLLGWITVT